LEIGQHQQLKNTAGAQHADDMPASGNTQPNQQPHINCLKNADAMFRAQDANMPMKLWTTSTAKVGIRANKSLLQLTTTMLMLNQVVMAMFTLIQPKQKVNRARPA